jgi:hypothetical protein
MSAAAPGFSGAAGGITSPGVLQSPDDTVAESTATDTSDSSTTAAQINAIVNGLQSVHFDERQAAAEALLEIPADQMTALVQAADNVGSGEVIRRVYDFLERCYVQDDDRSLVAAEILETAVSSPHWMTAELAKDILARNGQVRVTRALLELQALGASVRPRDPREIWDRRRLGPVGIAGFGMSDDIIRIDIDEDWTGNERGIQLFQRLSPLINDLQGMRGMRLGVYLIEGHPLTDAQVAALKSMLGDRRVVSRGKVALGITADPFFGDNIGCRIGTVSRGSSAGDAGLQPDDIILKLGDDTVKDFDHLVELLKKYDPGDVVKMAVQRAPAPLGFPEQRFRGGQLLEIPVTLKGWNDLE